MLTRSRCLAALAVVAALAPVAGASAMTKTHTSGATSHAVTAKTMAVTKAKAGTGVVRPVKNAGPVVAAISAFPTGGKGSGTEATCALWTERLQLDQKVIDDAPDTDKEDASGPLNEDVDNALDAGCAVIY